MIPYTVVGVDSKTSDSDPGSEFRLTVIDSEPDSCRLVV